VPPKHRPLQCSLHDWGGLRLQLLFVYSGPLADGCADGAYERHNELSAWLLRKGRAWMEADGRERVVQSGEWLVCTGKKIRQVLSHDVSLLSVRVRHQWPEGTPLFSGGPLCLFEAAGHPELESAAMEMVRDVGRIDWGSRDRSYAFLWENRISYGAYMRQQSHLFLWLGQLADILVREGWKLEIPAGVDARLAQALFVIDSQDADGPYPLREMEAASGLDIKKLNRICEGSTGLTLHAYWEKRRGERARRALEQGGASVKEIASGLGFSQLSHFSAWFKRHAGKPPRAWRADFIKKNPG